MSPLMTEVLASQDLVIKRYDELAARRIARTAKTAIAAIERLQRESDLAQQSPAAQEHERRHAARVQERADRLRDEFKLVKN